MQHLRLEVCSQYYLKLLCPFLFAAYPCQARIWTRPRPRLVQGATVPRPRPLTVVYTRKRVSTTSHCKLRFESPFSGRCCPAVLTSKRINTYMIFIQEHTAKEELRKLQVLAGALQNANNPPTEPGLCIPQRDLSEKMDALNEQLDDFEKRFASSGPEVKQMLAHLITNPSMAEELALASDPNITPQSSDSAQTQSATDSGHQRWAYSSPVQGGHAGLPHSSPQRAMPSPSHHRMGDVETSPMFPALTPSNSLAQQVTSREALSDCAASFPSMLPAMVRTLHLAPLESEPSHIRMKEPIAEITHMHAPGTRHAPQLELLLNLLQRGLCVQNRKDAALANQLRHRLADIDRPSAGSGGTIRNSLTQVSISETAEFSFPSK